jgi:1,4-alpha-glucan branching enzyme
VEHGLDARHLEYYIGEDPVHRRYHQNNLTFGLLYAFSENFVLPISHDEVVHGKGSLLAQDAGRPLAEIRQSARLSRLHVDPSGQEAALHGLRVRPGAGVEHQFSLDWHLLDDPAAQGRPAPGARPQPALPEPGDLHEKDCEPEGFEWIDAADSEQSVLSFLRKGSDPGSVTIVVCNFTPVVRHGYRIGVPLPGDYREALNSDDQRYGGSGVGSGPWSRPSRPPGTAGRTRST